MISVTFHGFFELTKSLINPAAQFMLNCRTTARHPRPACKILLIRQAAGDWRDLLSATSQFARVIFRGSLSRSHGTPPQTDDYRVVRKRTSPPPRTFFARGAFPNPTESCEMSNPLFTDRLADTRLQRTGRLISTKCGHTTANDDGDTLNIVFCDCCWLAGLRKLTLMRGPPRFCYFWRITTGLLWREHKKWQPLLRYLNRWTQRHVFRAAAAVAESGWITQGGGWTGGGTEHGTATTAAAER